ncbi:Protein fam72a [Nowakowskiella sp. JEL0407]|nr:Protein fam72a [Nowakowskiella sp. JEL0407]
MSPINAHEESEHSWIRQRTYHPGETRSPNREQEIPRNLTSRERLIREAFRAQYHHRLSVAMGSNATAPSDLILGNLTPTFQGNTGSGSSSASSQNQRTNARTNRMRRNAVITDALREITNRRTYTSTPNGTNVPATIEQSGTFESIPAEIISFLPSSSSDSGMVTTVQIRPPTYSAQSEQQPQLSNVMGNGITMLARGRIPRETINPSIHPQFRSKSVCKLFCKSCGEILCRRGMKAILLGNTKVELFSTDVQPKGVQVVYKDYTTQNCKCRIKDAACLSCGSAVGYHVTQPCGKCLDSCNNGHFWMFHANNVNSSDRKDPRGSQLAIYFFTDYVLMDGYHFRRKSDALVKSTPF